MMDTLRKDLKSILIFCIESKEELDVLEFFFQLERSILRDDFDLLIQFFIVYDWELIFLDIKFKEILLIKLLYLFYKRSECRIKIST